MASLREIREERLKKLAILREAGVDPYPVVSKRGKTCLEVSGGFTKLKTAGKKVAVVGRIKAKRGQGGMVFVDIYDGTGSLQLVFKKDELGDSLQLFNQTSDLGDFIEVTGVPFLTKRKEKSLLIKSWTMLSKSLRPLPDSWSGFKDTEERFRRRYLDSLMSNQVKERFVLRSDLITQLRTFLNKEGFLEVETPMLQPIPGGATAKPFVTHHNALDIDLYLRVSPELYLKQMLVGGFEKVYEISRNFRNEGIDQTHNPEFTMLEFYESFSDAGKQRKFVEKLIKAVVKKTTGQSKISFDGQTIDFSTPFKTMTYFELLKRYALIQSPAEISKSDLILKARQLGVEISKSDNKEKILDNIYKKMCRPKLIQPTFIIDYPKDYLPLAKKLPTDETLVDAFQLVVGGVELVKAFSELNDPIDQRERFTSQEKMKAAGDDEAQVKDEAFLEALEYGMPPAGGVGIGIDRLAMLLTDTTNIREVIFFPTMRPKK